MNKGIRFTDEFKQDAVAQFVERGYAVREVADPDSGGDGLPTNNNTLAQVIQDTGVNVLSYFHDFGDSWDHRIAICDISDPVPSDLYPRLTDDTGKCPPEDVDGFPGYEEFLQAMIDPKDPEHSNLKDWFGGQFDPNTPESDELRLSVRKLANRWKPKNSRN